MNPCLVTEPHAPHMWTKLLIWGKEPEVFNCPGVPR